MTSEDLVIGVPVRNQTAFASVCLETVARHRVTGARILVIDDGSDRACRAYLEAFAAEAVATDLLRHESRRGFPYNCNEIIYNSSAETICILNSDTIVAPTWDQSVLQAMKIHPSFGLGGPSTSSSHTPQALAGLFARRMEQDPVSVAEIGRVVAELFRDRYQLLPALGGFCLFLRRDVVRSIGFFDERFGLGSAEEDDFVCRARAAGYQAVWAMGAYVHHFGHRTFAGELRGRSRELWQRNRLIFEIKQLVPSMGEIVHPPNVVPLSTPVEPSCTGELE